MLHLFQIIIFCCGAFIRVKSDIIWDSATKAGKLLFNSFIIPELDDKPQLTDILLKFRKIGVATCGYLDKMYNQVEILDVDWNILSQNFLVKFTAQNNKRCCIIYVLVWYLLLGMCCARKR